jgi:hypothetical protein
VSAPVISVCHVCTSHGTVHYTNEGFVFAPITGLLMYGSAATSGQIRSEGYGSWSSVAYWGSPFLSYSCALGIGMKEIRLPGWQSFAQGNQGPREGSSKCQGVKFP